MSSIARGERQDLARVGADRAAPWPARAPGGCACRRRAASSASPPRGRRCPARRRGSAGRPGSPRPRRAARRGTRVRRSAGAAQSSVSWLTAASPGPAAAPGRRRGPGARARRRPARRAPRSPRRAPAAASADRSPVRSCSAARSRRSTRASRAVVSSSVMGACAFCRASRSTAARMPLTKPGRVRAAEGLGRLDRLVDRALGRDRRVGRDGVGMQHLEQRDAHDRLLQRGDAVDRPALGVALDERVEVLGVVLRGVGQRAREGRGVALEDVVELATGQVVLVERRTPRRRGCWSAPARLQALGPRHVLAGARVDLDAVADVRRRAGPGPSRRSRASRACCRRPRRCRRGGRARSG